MAYGARNFPREAIRERRINFEATKPNRRAHRDLQIDKPGARLGHRANSCSDDSADKPAPSGVQPTHYAVRFIHHQDWNAISSEEAKEDALAARHHAVAVGPLAARIGINTSHLDAMDLIDESYIANCGHLHSEQLPIAIDRVLLITHKIREIQRRISSDAGTADSSDKAVTNRRIVPRAQDRDRAAAC